MTPLQLKRSYIKKKRRKKCKHIIFQNHHIIYGENEVIVKIRRKVHYVITLLNRYKDFTYNEKRAIRYIVKNKPVLRLNKPLLKIKP